MAEICEHNTGQGVVNLSPIDGIIEHGEYSIWRCDWGCGKLLVSIDNNDGITETWELDSRSEIEALRQQNEKLQRDLTEILEINHGLLKDAGIL